MDESRRLLYDHPFLEFLSPEARNLVVDTFVPVSFAFGQLIVREGDEADAFYVLASGRARVVRGGAQGEEVSLGVLRPGDSFGEIGLFEHTRRTATVRASTEVQAFRLDRSVFQALVQREDTIRHRLELQIKQRHLRDFFRLYTPFTRLPHDGLQQMLDDIEPVSAEPGELVIRQGEMPGPLFVIEEGRARAFVEEDGRRRYVGYLRKGDVFGEIALFKGVPRTASVETVSACRLLRLPAAAYRRLLDTYPDFKAQIEECVLRYDYKHVARVPLDFADEILPAESRHEPVGPDQVDADADEATRTEAAPFASDGHFLKGRRRIRRVPFVRQLDQSDCGAAALAIVCRHFGRAVSLARIRQLVHTSLDGTSLRALCHAADSLGLAARAVKASAARLADVPLPAIVHWEGNHWVVLYDVNAAHVRIADPALGLRRLPRREFEARWSGYTALFDYTERFETAPESRATLGWLWRFFRPFTGLLANAVALAVVVSGLQMVLPVAIQIIVDRVLVERDLPLLHTLVVGMAVVSAFMIVSMIMQRYLLSFAAVRIDAATLDFVTRKLLTLPLSYFTSRRTGDVQRRLGGLRQLREFLVQNAVSGLTAVVQLVAAVALMLVYSPVLTLAFLVAVPFYAALMHVSARWLRPTFDALEEGFAKYQSHQVDAIRGIETVKALGAEASFRERMLNQFLAIARRQFNADFTVMCYEGAVHAVTFLSTVLFLWIGARQVMEGHLTIGGLVAFNALVALANAPIGTLLSLWDNLQLSTVLLDRLNDVFEQDAEQAGAVTRPVRTLDGHIRVQKLGFRYGGPDAPAILEDISFDAPAGRTVAIVGRSGSGKTTLVKCLAGLLEPTDGAILYDGIDLKTLNYRELRRQIGFVLQESYLFSDTIAGNIAFGDDEPDMERVVWAARVANAHEFIEQLPLGYDTRVGETGIALAGGQRQRLAIARAVYHRPAVLVFDEATSSLDSESERAIKENLDQLLTGRTAFVIAHRLSTVRDADVILVLDRGRLVENGTHDDLLKRRGLYFYLTSQQLTL